VKEMSDTKLLARLIYDDFITIPERYNVVQKAVQDLLLGILKALKDRMNQTPDEQTFLAVLSEVADLAIDWTKVLKPPMGHIAEVIDGHLILAILKGIDKAVFDRWFGQNWFEKLKEQIRAVDTVANA
jgi:hypothetical protein